MGAGVRVPGAASSRGWFRFASAGLAVVIAVMATYTVWSIVSSWQVSTETSRAVHVAAEYQRALQALGDGRSLEREYRLDERPEVRQEFNVAADRLNGALEAIGTLGDASDRESIGTIRALHKHYVSLVHGVFALVQADRPAEAARLTEQQVDPVFNQITPILTRESSDHQESVQAQVERMSALQHSIFRRFLLISAIGVVFAATFFQLLRVYRRQLSAERERAAFDAQHDRLTALPNRQLLVDRLSAAFAEGAGAGDLAVIMLDVDRFKQINDTLGHSYGDQLLIQVGVRLRDYLRDGDLVARLGNDEFAVLLRGVHGRDAVTDVAHRLREAVQAPLQIDDIGFDLEVSLGVALGHEHGDDADTLLRHAEVAMYVAKGGSRGVAVYRAEEDTHDAEALALLGELRGAMSRRELVLYYQPKVDLATGAVSGVEALVRWVHPTRGIVPPVKFIPLAEQTGLIAPMTRYILGEALAQARRWSDAGHPVRVSVNLAARNLTDDTLFDHVVQALHDHGLPPHLLCLELTESAIITEPDQARRLLGRLHAAGVALAVDDFGTGYTSLTQLRDLPITELKIDRTFVDVMTRNAKSSVIVHSVIALAHGLGMSTVAEGVEDEATLCALAEAGCRAAQGYHLSRPLPADEYEKWRDARPTPHAAAA